MLIAGVDCHKRDSVVHVLDAAGATVKKAASNPTACRQFEGFFEVFLQRVAAPSLGFDELGLRLSLPP